MSLIISNKFRATLSVLFPAVMATSPAADARAASPAPEEARPAEENVAENLLKAEMNSLVKMMADVSKVPEENKCENHARKMRTFFTRRLEPKTKSSNAFKWSLRPKRK